MKNKIKIGTKIGFLNPKTGKYMYSDVIKINESKIYLLQRFRIRSMDNYFTETMERVFKYCDEPSEDWNDGRKCIKIVNRKS